MRFIVDFFTRTKSFITDTTPVIFCVILVFMCPKENVFRGKPYSNLMKWKVIETEFPWGVILLGGWFIVIFFLLRKKN